MLAIEEHHESENYVKVDILAIVVSSWAKVYKIEKHCKLMLKYELSRPLHSN